MKTICSAGQDSMDDPVIYNDTHIHKKIYYLALHVIFKLGMDCGRGERNKKT